MTDPDRYAITVRKVSVDGEDVWRATVRELPDLAEFAGTREEAVALARDAIEDLQASALEDGHPFPEPMPDEEEYSGRVTLRMSRSMHRATALRAMSEDVSLNSYIVECIALRSGAAVTAQPFAVPPIVSFDYNKFLELNLNQTIPGNVMMVTPTATGGMTGRQYAIGTATHWGSTLPTVPEYLLEKRRSA